MRRHLDNRHVNPHLIAWTGEAGNLEESMREVPVTAMRGWRKEIRMIGISLSARVDVQGPDVTHYDLTPRPTLTIGGRKYIQTFNSG